MLASRSMNALVSLTVFSDQVKVITLIMIYCCKFYILRRVENWISFMFGNSQHTDALLWVLAFYSAASSLKTPTTRFNRHYSWKDKPMCETLFISYIWLRLVCSHGYGFLFTHSYATPRGTSVLSVSKHPPHTQKWGNECKLRTKFRKFKHRRIPSTWHKSSHKPIEIRSYRRIWGSDRRSAL